MSTVSGLRILQKNVALSAALRFNGVRTKIVPKCIVQYARFATQLDFPRWSDHLTNSQATAGNLENNLDDKIDLEEPHSAKENRYRVPRRPSKFDTGCENLGTTLDKGVAPLVRDQQEYAENSYIYRHIHKRLDMLIDVRESIDRLPIKSCLAKLVTLIDKKNTMLPAEYIVAIEQLLRDIQGYIRTMNQKDLATLLTAIKTNNSIEHRRLKRMIDEELRQLLKNHVHTRSTDLDLWFYLADIYFECYMQSTFVKSFVKYLSSERELVLSNSQFLHSLFLIILERNQNGFLRRYEHRILSILRDNQTSLEDISIICLAYFKTQTKITNPTILRLIIDKTAEYLPSIDFTQPGYCSIIKSIRYSNIYECCEDVQRFIVTMNEKSDSAMIFANPFNAVHTIKMMEAYRVYDSKLLDLITSTMFQNLDQYRIKDIQYALTSLSNFSHKTEPLDTSFKRNLDRLCADIVSEIRYDCDKQAYHLLPILRAFQIFDYHNDKLMDYMNKLLTDQSKVVQMSKVLEFEKSAMLAYVVTRIENREVKFMEGNEELLKKIGSSIQREEAGNSGSVRQDSSIRYLDFMLKSTGQNHYLAINNLFRNLAQSLAKTAQLQDPAYRFNFQVTLPHQNYADLVISKDCKEPGQYDAETFMPKIVPAGQRHCLVFGVRKFDYVDGHERLCGYKKLITRILAKIGYTIVLVNLDNTDVEDTASQVKAIFDRNS